jgi:hypothetical protein
MRSGAGITFSGTAPGTTTNTLYSDSGTLKFGGSSISSPPAADFIVYKADGNTSVINSAGGVIYSNATSTTADLAAWQAAVYATTSGTQGKPIKNRIVGVGPFYIDGTLLINKTISIDNMILYQTGAHSTLYVANPGELPQLYNVNVRNSYLYINSSSGCTNQYAVVVKNTTWVDFEDTDIMSYVAGSGQLAIILNDTAEWTRFTDCHIRGAVKVDASTDNWFKGCWFNTYDCSSGVYVLNGAMNNHWEGCHFISPTSGTTIYTPTVRFVTSTHQNHITDCHFDGGGALTSGPAITLDNSYGNIITGNSFTYHHVETIMMNGSSCLYNTISDCFFWNGNVKDDSHNTILLQAGAAKNTIANCKFWIDEARTNKGYAAYELNYLAQPNYNVVEYPFYKSTYENTPTVTGAQSKVVT